MILKSLCKETLYSSLDKLSPDELKSILKTVESLAFKWNLIQNQKYKYRHANYGTFDSEVKQYLP